MRTLTILFLSLASAFHAAAQQPIEVEIVGGADNHHLTWTTTQNFNYQVEASPDLVNWIDTGIAEPGTGGPITYCFISNAPKWFYRIKEIEDPYNGAFLILPIHDQEVALIDGVCFSFDLHVLPDFPNRIRIYQREYDSEDSCEDRWEQIGLITEFAERTDVKFVRGSVVWIPSVEGEYEVLAVAIDDQDNAVASATRRVIVGANEPPEITITGGPTSPSATAQPVVFETDFVLPDNEPITRVEFYDNGVLIGTDRAEPFGSSIRDLELPDFQYTLLRGVHNITARAFNARGAIGETTQPFVVEITGGNARPVVNEVTSPAGTLIVQQGQTFAVAYSVSDPDGANDLNRVEVQSLQEGTDSEVINSSSPFTGVTMDTTDWEPGSHTIIVRAYDNSGAFSYPATFNVFVQTAAGPTFAEQLVAYLVDGITVAPSGELFSGAQASSGEFDEGYRSGLEMDKGILLTSGKFEFWNGGNEAENKTYEWFLPGDDRLRDRLSGGLSAYVTHDAAALEFDVFCQNGQLEFEFQFGSEEYPEWVGRFNDGFIVTVNDVIVSLLPDGSDIVSVDSISDVIGYDLNKHLYLNNNINGFGININDTDIAPNLDPEDLDRLVEYDGMTIKLKGHVLVEAGNTYQVRIVIADAQDKEYDSGLFFQKHSLKSINPEP
jgi:hypothetical protein